MHRQLIARPSPQLRRRVGFAAVKDGVTSARYCQRLLATWLRDKPLLLTMTVVVGPYTEFRVPVTENVHQQLRVEAARLDFSINEMTLRILDALCPHETEVFAAVLSEPIQG